VGGHLGVNYQLRQFLIGAEISYSDAELRNTSIGASVVPADRFTVDMTDLLMITGRLGYVHGQYLVYARGGYASAEVETRAASATQSVAATISQRESGWTIGGGLEARIISNLLFSLEYNYLSFARDQFSGVTAGAGVPLHVDLDDLHAHIVTARLSILFGPHACCSEGVLGKY
jgi:opacity protein-like surface antigen